MRELTTARSEFYAKHQLTWDSWWLYRPHFVPIAPGAPDHSIRKISLTRDEAKTLHLFFVSAAWRAAASRLRDFADVQLPKFTQNRLREQILQVDEWDWRTTPVSLVQLSTIGEHHHQSPFLTEKIIPAHSDKPERRLPFMRLYMCGLIAHVHYDGYEGLQQSKEPLFLGGDHHLLISSISYEASFQYSNLLTVAFESYSSPTS